MKPEYFKRLMDIQALAWKGDDLIAQEDLFDLQTELAGLLLDMATPNQRTLLAMKFPWLYKEVK